MMDSVVSAKIAVSARATYVFQVGGQVLIRIESVNVSGDVIKTRELTLSDLEAEALFLMTQGA